MNIIYVNRRSESVDVGSQATADQNYKAMINNTAAEIPNAQGTSGLTGASSAPSGWMTLTLRAAAIYNILWGAWCIFFPGHLWELMGLAQPNYPFLWQCIGMIVGVYGVGYWIAAKNPATHWPIVLVGLLGKIFGPIGFAQAYFIDQVLPLRFGWMLVTNDFIWWIPFVLILRHAYGVHERARIAGRYLSGARAAGAGSSDEAFVRDGLDVVTSNRLTLGQMSEQGRVLVVFLRHSGCTFCREALADIARVKQSLAGAGTTICLVHMGSKEQGAAMLAEYGLDEIAIISDPERRMYKAFDLRRGTAGQLLSWRSWIRGAHAAISGGHWVGRLVGDGFQMPGAFVVYRRAIVGGFIHETASDRPDYCGLAACGVVVP